MTSKAITESHRIDATPGTSAQRAVADEGVGNGRIEDGGVGPEQSRQAAYGGERAERDDERRQAEVQSARR